MHTNTGHSGQMVDTTIQSKNENAVRYVETLLPVDFDTSGPILADEIQKTLLCAMPPSTTLTALMDCSLGGSIITLPYAYSHQDESIHYNNGFEFEALIGLAIIGGILVAASGNDDGGGGGGTSGVDASGLGSVVNMPNSAKDGGGGNVPDGDDCCDPNPNPNLCQLEGWYQWEWQYFDSCMNLGSCCLERYKVLLWNFQGRIM
jgi:hypothetical protein